MSRSCKKTHKRVSGACVPNNVVNKKLYARIKKRISRRVKRKGQRWGAYTSGNLVQAYKRAGGKYRGRKKSFIRRTKSRKRKSRRKSRRRRRRKSRKKSKRRSRKKSKRRYRVSKKVNRMNSMSVRYLNIDYYSRSGCHYCNEATYLFKKEGILGDLNVKKDVKLPQGVKGVPYFYSNKTGKSFMGYPKSVGNLIQKLS